MTSWDCHALSSISRLVFQQPANYWLVSLQAGPSGRGIRGCILVGSEQCLSKNGLESSPVCIFQEPAHLRIWFDRALHSVEADRCGWWVSRNLFKPTNSGLPEISTFLTLCKRIQIRRGVSTGLQETGFSSLLGLLHRGWIDIPRNVLCPPATIHSCTHPACFLQVWKLCQFWANPGGE